MMQANWNYIVAAVCIIAAIMLVWQEVKRPNKALLILRIAAVVAAMVMTACIALPINYKKEIRQKDKDTFILLTKGYTSDSLPTYKNARIYTLDKQVRQRYNKSVLLNGLGQLSDTIKNGTLIVYGDGLSNNDLEQLGNTHIVFHPQPAPGGISNINWNSIIKAGEQLRVQGSYNNPSGKKVELLLNGLNTDLDRLTIIHKGPANFELSTSPKTNGRVVYSLQSVIGNDTISLGSIPVEVEPVKPLRVLLLSASPNFETRFLKNWLSQNGYRVAERSAISKDKFNTEYINMSKFPLGQLSASTFNRFDVVIGDLSVLNNFTGAESAALKQQVADKGLGVIVRADSSGKSSWLQKRFTTEVANGKEIIGTLFIGGKKSASNKLNGGRAFLRYQNGTQPLIINSQNRILASSDINGSGKVVFTTLDNTYTWLLGGNLVDYSACWSGLITNAARRDTAIQNDLQLPVGAFVDEPVKMQITGTGPSPLMIDGSNVSAAQNLAIPFQWNADYWPKAIGWQSLTYGGRSNNWFVYKDNDWQTIRSLAKTDATLKYAKLHKPVNNVTKQIQQIVRIEVPKIYFYILLLAACTFLWIEAKLS